MSTICLAAQRSYTTGEAVWFSYRLPSLKNVFPRFYVSTSKSIIKALINMHSFEIQLSPIG